MNSTNLSHRARKFFDLIEFDNEETLIAEIRKHPFGLFIIYATGFVIALLLFVFLVVGGLLVDVDLLQLNRQSGTIRAVIVLFGLIMTILTFGATAIGAYLYQSNVVLVTSEKIAQLLYKSLFDRKISQLSIGDVQDVTVSQVGVFARIFNYGTLVIETAGEQQNYTFTYVPHPYENAKLIVGAHEENLKKFGN